MSLVASGTVVLVVDDDSDLRDCIADVLMMEGYDARPLRSADSAWTEVVAGTQPAAIILDQWIAGMSSREFVRRLRESTAPAAAELAAAIEQADTVRAGKDVEMARVAANLAAAKRRFLHGD